MDIKELIKEGDQEGLVIRKKWNNGTFRTFGAFANTDGGMIILGYDTKNNIAVEITDSIISDVKNDLAIYSDICKISSGYVDSIRVLLINVLKSNAIIYIKGKAWYRVGLMDLQFDARMLSKVYNTIYNSVKDLSVAEVARETDIGKEYVKNILDSGLGEVPIEQVKKGGKNYYYIDKKVVDLKLLEKDFSKVNNSDELIRHLEYKATKIDNRKMLHQYTTIDAVYKIIESGEYYLGTPANMNDKYEYNSFGHGKAGNEWDNTFFTCFMREDNESIAMWSMYSMPWENGVRLSIPAEKIKQWIEGVETLYIANAETKKKVENRKLSNSKFKKSYYMIAYTNEGDLEEIGQNHILKVGEAKNIRMSNVYNDDKLRGYIKNIAWGYEKEVRFRIDIPHNSEAQEEDKIKGIIIKIPYEILSAVEITKGPRVDEKSVEWVDLIDLLKKKKVGRISKSLFDRKLQNMACDRCEKQIKESKWVQ